jgi:hypothetical protein
MPFRDPVLATTTETRLENKNVHYCTVYRKSSINVAAFPDYWEAGAQITVSKLSGIEQKRANFSRSLPPLAPPITGRLKRVPHADHTDNQGRHGVANSHEEMP